MWLVVSKARGLRLASPSSPSSPSGPSSLLATSLLLIGLLVIAAAIGLSLPANQVAAASPPPAAAAQTSGITISPTQKDITISSGLLQANTAVTLTNHSGARLLGTIKLLDFKTLDETGGLLFTQAGVSATKYGLAKYMTLPNGDVINLADGQSLTIPVDIINQPDLAPGGHYGAVVITIADPVANPNTSASFKQELVSLLLVRKLGGEIYSLHLQSLATDTTTGLPMVAKLRFQNGGNVHVVPRGYVTVTNDKGVVVEKGTINADSLPVLPGSSRPMVTELQTIAPLTASRSYKVTAYYRYDGQSNFSSQTLYLSNSSRSLPLILTAIGLALLAAIGWGWRFRHRFSRRKRYSIP